MKRKIQLQTISKKYLNYLQKYDTKISNHTATDGGVYVGAVLGINHDISYFVPLTSYSKKKEQKMKYRKQFILSLHELGDGNNKLGYMLFNNMIPVPKTELQKIDLSDQTIPKNNMMKLQQTYMRTIINGIESKAEVVYRKRIQGNPYFVNWCCDFTLLEQKCMEFIENNKKHIIDDDLEIEL